MGRFDRLHYMDLQDVFCKRERAIPSERKPALKIINIFENELQLVRW
jgi:hypothetical protein